MTGSCTNADDRGTSIHEAAHAVVALLLGLPLRDVTREVEEWGLLGSVGLKFPADYTPDAYPDLARRAILVALAGPIAEIRATKDLTFSGALGDIDDALTTAHAVVGADWHALIADSETRARALISEFWTSITAVADALSASPTGTLEPGDVRTLITRN